VHQVVPTFARRDAIGVHSLIAQRLLRAAGFASHIYTGSAPRHLRHLVRDLRSLPHDDRTWVLYQCSTGAPIADALREASQPLIVDYHNITPARFFAKWEPRVADELEAGREQVARLSERAALGIADSSFNRAELDRFGYRSTTVVPVLVDLAASGRRADRRTLDRLRGEGGEGGAEWLFVGRLSPNKAQHDVIQAFAVYRRTYDPTARLSLVGGSSSLRYERALRSSISALGLDGAVRMVGSVSAPVLTAYFQIANIFVCLSDHEGFCVPLLEAMHHRVPIVAFASTAVPETLGDAGLCLPDKQPAAVAHAVSRVLTDGGLRAQLVNAGTRRLGDFDLTRTSATFTAAITRMVGVTA
jgi:glycosyltransferase involved in cell wall biosynthesis